MDVTLNIAKEFSDIPAGRLISEVEGPHSGEEFREKFLYPRFLEAVKLKAKLVVNLDLTYGMPQHWIDEAFGGMVRNYDIDYDELIATLEFVATEGESPDYVLWAWDSINAYFDCVESDGL